MVLSSAEVPGNTVSLLNSAAAAKLITLTVIRPATTSIVDSNSGADTNAS